MSPDLSTNEVVGRLRRVGLAATAVGLRSDVHRQLVSPGMPAAESSGRGRTARWTPMAVRRAEYLGRLRRRGVSGRVLPLLAFVYDGWGWEHIRGAIGAAVQQGTE